MVLLVRAPLILFDGVCNLCYAWVRFVVRRDPTGIFCFAAQQSLTGQAIIEEHVPGVGQLSSVILIEENAIYTESDAVLQILARLGVPWSWIAFLRIIPAESVMPAIASSSAVGTGGSGEVKSAKSHQRMCGRDSSSDPSETQSSDREVLAAHD
jgi:predicted DCC family thiol-disulfide oxidoreductase YuxK